MKQADLVIVIENGRITQMGKHDDLMATDGHYRAVARAQLSLDDDEIEARREDPSHIKRARDAERISLAQEEARAKQAQHEIETRSN